MPDIRKLVSGFNIFKATTYQKQKDIISHLIIQNAKPSTMVICCSDIRLTPAEILATNPGDLYIISNMGGFVPKYDSNGVHGIMSAIEYAVNILEVENIIVLGHAKCDSIKTLMNSENKTISNSMEAWLSIAAEARNAVKKELANSSEEQQLDACEHESIIVSMRNLLTYPYIKKRMAENKINIFGWHFNVEKGEITSFNPDSRFFEPI